MYYATQDHDDFELFTEPLRGQSGRSSVRLCRTRLGFFFGLDMKRIPLPEGKFTLVDDEDYSRLSCYKWHVHGELGDGTKRVYRYVARWMTFKGLCDTNPHRLTKDKRILILMSRQILRLSSDDPRVVDHRDHNILDNQKTNLRACTHQQNIYNQRKRRGVYASDYKGVTPAPSGNWQAHIRSKYICTCEREIDAAKAYDEKAKELFGEYACLNFPEPKP